MEPAAGIRHRNPPPEPPCLHLTCDNIFPTNNYDLREFETNTRVLCLEKTSSACNFLFLEEEKNEEGVGLLEWSRIMHIREAIKRP